MEELVGCGGGLRDANDGEDGRGGGGGGGTGGRGGGGYGGGGGGVDDAYALGGVVIKYLMGEDARPNIQQVTLEGLARALARETGGTLDDTLVALRGRAERLPNVLATMMISNSTDIKFVQPVEDEDDGTDLSAATHFLTGFKFKYREPKTLEQIVTAGDKKPNFGKDKNKTRPVTLPLYRKKGPFGGSTLSWPTRGKKDTDINNGSIRDKVHPVTFNKDKHTHSPYLLLVGGMAYAMFDIIIAASLPGALCVGTETGETLKEDKCEEDKRRLFLPAGFTFEAACDGAHTALRERKKCNSPGEVLSCSYMVKGTSGGHSMTCDLSSDKYCDRMSPWCDKRNWGHVIWWGRTTRDIPCIHYLWVAQYGGFLPWHICPEGPDCWWWKYIVRFCGTESLVSMALINHIVLRFSARSIGVYRWKYTYANPI